MADNYIQIKYSSNAKDKADTLKELILADLPEQDVRLDTHEKDGVEARWFKNGRSFLILLTSDPEIETALKRMEALKNL